MDAAKIISAAISQVGTDASRATVLDILNEQYAAQVSDARWLRIETSIGTTVAGTNEYVIPIDVVEAYGLRVGNFPYSPIGEDIMWRLNSGLAVARVGREGVFSQGANSAGATTVTLYPTPGESGTAITLYAAYIPSALTDSSGSSPITPSDTHSSLIAGTAALLLERIDEREDLAAPFQAKFDAVTEKIRRRKNNMLRGGQPAQLLVAGVHF